ncbi:unnamed protein product, partial [Sphacelaria rigidula]
MQKQKRGGKDNSGAMLFPNASKGRRSHKDMGGFPRPTKAEGNGNSHDTSPTFSSNPSLVDIIVSCDNLRRCLRGKGLAVAESDMREVLATHSSMVDALTFLIDS